MAPQNRERVFTISIRNDIKKVFEFPPKQELKLRLKDVLEEVVDEKYYLSEEVGKTFVPNKTQGNVIGDLKMDKWQDQMKRIYDINEYSPTINTMQGGNLQPKIIDYTYGFEQEPRIYEETCLTIRSGRQGLKVAKPTIKRVDEKVIIGANK